MKYIIIRYTLTLTETVIVFPRTLSHKQVARICRGSDYTVTAAGYVERDEGSWRAYGGSRSLRIGSRSQDSAIIAMQYQ